VQYSRKLETIDSIINFWFSDDIEKHWFNSTEELDQDIKFQFECTYLAAVDKRFEHWQSSLAGCLALILIYDQFPLHMYRGNKKSFSTDEQSRAVAVVAINNSFDEKMSDKQKVFCYMPFMHSEELDDQVMAVDLYFKAGLTTNLRFAKHHHDLVARFGRFPHRNLILGRENTADEAEYLKSNHAFLG